MQRNTPQISEFSINSWLKSILAGWPLLIMFIIAGAIGGSVIGKQSRGTYEANAHVIVDHNPEDALRPDVYFDRDRNDLYVDRQTRTLEEIAESDEVFRLCQQNMADSGVSVDADAFSGLWNQKILPHPVQGTWRFVSRDSDPAQAMGFANAWAEAFVSVVDDAILQAEAYANQERLVYLLTDTYIQENDRCSWIHAMIQPDNGSLAAMVSMDLSADYLQWILLEYSARAGLSAHTFETIDNLDSASDMRGFFEQVVLLLETEDSICPAQLEQIQLQIEDAKAGLLKLSTTRPGIDRQLEIEISQAATLPQSPYVKSGRGLFIGALSGLIVGLLLTLFFPRWVHR